MHQHGNFISWTCVVSLVINESTTCSKVVEQGMSDHGLASDHLSYFGLYVFELGGYSKTFC